MSGRTWMMLGVGCVAGWVAASLNLPDETGKSPGVGKPPPAEKEKLSALEPAAEIPDSVRLVVDSEEAVGFGATRAFLLDLENATASDCRRWWLLMKNADADLRSRLLRRWATLDPRGAHDHLVGSGKLALFAHIVLPEWAAVDVEAAMEAALGMGSSHHHHLHGVMGGAGADQIERLYDLLVERGLDKTAPGTFAQIFSYLAKVDQHKAADLALAFGTEQVTGLENLTHAWVKRDGADALAWAKGVKNPKARARALGMVTREWMEIDPLGAMDAMGDEIDFGVLHFYANPMPTGTLSTADFAKLLRRADELATENPDKASGLFQAMLGGLQSGTHPERLAELAHGLGEIPSHLLERAVVDAATYWARKDQEAVVDFINSVENEVVRGSAIRGLVNQLARTEPLRALEFLGTLDEQVEGINARVLMKGIFATGMAPAEAIAQIPEPMRDEVLGALGHPFFRSDLEPRELVELLGSQPSGEKRDAGMMYVAGDWAMREPQAAATWVGELEAGKLQRYAAGNVAASWATTDLDSAAEWSMSLESPDSRSHALANVARIAANNVPERAVEISREITDAKQRNESLYKGLRVLAKQDPDRVTELLDELGNLATEELRQQVTGAVEESRFLHQVLE